MTERQLAKGAAYRLAVLRHAGTRRASTPSARLARCWLEGGSLIALKNAWTSNRAQEHTKSAIRRASSSGASPCTLCPAFVTCSTRALG